MKVPEASEYRIARLRERLADEEISELGVQIAMRGGYVHLWGTVSTAACRNEIVRIAETELGGLPVRADLTVVCATAPEGPEELE
ncbi:BON domain-containing protein [Streptomyces sp. NPDC096176]|uniref:BON domain-containing protein n=1 Tax=Streptomyces sp. NPDC096176 TaxID=3366079 RepID=UPI003823CD42